MLPLAPPLTHTHTVRDSPTYTEPAVTPAASSEKKINAQNCYQFLSPLVSPLLPGSFPIASPTEADSFPRTGPRCPIPAPSSPNIWAAEGNRWEAPTAAGRRRREEGRMDDPKTPLCVCVSVPFPVAYRLLSLPGALPSEGRGRRPPRPGRARPARRPRVRVRPPAARRRRGALSGSRRACPGAVREAGGGALLVQPPARGVGGCPAALPGPRRPKRDGVDGEGGRRAPGARSGREPLSEALPRRSGCPPSLQAAPTPS